MMTGEMTILRLNHVATMNLPATLSLNIDIINYRNLNM